jgi:DNA-binding transcriptional LysR family regulator
MSINRLTSRQLQVFIAVAGRLNFTAAAADLHLAQSAISVTIRDIEARLGVRLLDRDTRNVALTPAGTKLLELARRIVDLQAGTAREFDAFLAGDSGELVISALPSVAAATLPPIISQFIHDNPGVQLHLRDRIADAVADDLISGRADIGVTAANGLPQELDSVPLISNPLVAILPAGHDLSRHNTVTWRQLAGEPFITIGHGSVQPLIDRAFHVIDTPASSYIEAGSIQSIAGLVASGLGVSSLPLQAVPLLSFANVVTRPLTEPTVFHRLVIAWRAESPHTIPAQRFVEHLRASIGGVFDA